MQITLQIDSRDRGDVEDALKVVQSLREGLKLNDSAALKPWTLAADAPVAHPAGSSLAILPHPRAEAETVEPPRTLAPAPKKTRTKKPKISDIPDPQYADLEPDELIPPEPMAAPRGITHESTLFATTTPSDQPTADDVRVALSEYIAAHSVPEAIKHLNSFGATRLGELQPEKYAEFLAKLEE